MDHMIARMADACRHAGLDGAALERLLNLAEDPTAVIANEPERLAVVGLCLRDLGARIVDAAKAQTHRLDPADRDDRGWLADGVRFQERAPYEQSRVDVKVVKARYPREAHPDLYQKVSVAGSWAVGWEKAS